MQHRSRLLLIPKQTCQPQAKREMAGAAHPLRNALQK